MQSESRQRQDEVRYQVATTELDLAITFFMVAAAAQDKDEDRSKRAIANAEHAYLLAATCLDCNMKAAQNHEIEEKFIRLNSVRRGCAPNAVFLSQ